MLKTGAAMHDYTSDEITAILIALKWRYGTWDKTARQLNVPERTVLRWRNGKARPSGLTIEYLDLLSRDSQIDGKLHAYRDRIRATYVGPTATSATPAPDPRAPGDTATE